MDSWVLESLRLILWNASSLAMSLWRLEHADTPGCLVEPEAYPCPFLRDGGDKKKCGVYPVRPNGCRVYPFETDFGRQGVDCLAAKQESLQSLRVGGASLRR